MMGKRTGLAYPGTIEMVLLAPIESNEEIMPLLQKTRSAIANELAKY